MVHGFKGLHGKGGQWLELVVSRLKKQVIYIRSDDENKFFLILDIILAIY
jgi:hypothetical protein